jgi:hypothetical protein
MMWNFFEFKCILEGNDELLTESGLVRRTKPELSADQQTQGVTPEPPKKAARVVRSKPEFRPRSTFGEDPNAYHTNKENPLMGTAISKQIVDKGAHLDRGDPRGASGALDDVIRDHPEFRKQLQSIAALVRSGSYRTSLGEIIGAIGGGGGGQGRAGGLSPDASKMAQALMLLRKLKIVDFVDAQGNSLRPGQPPNEETIIVPADSLYRGEQPEDVADPASQRAADKESRKGYGLTGAQQRQRAIRQRDLAQARDPKSMTGPSQGRSRAAMAEVQSIVKRLMQFKDSVGLDSPGGQKEAREGYAKLKELWGEPLDDKAREAVKNLAEKLVKIIKPAQDKQQSKKMHKEWLEFYSLMEQYGV